AVQRTLANATSTRELTPLLRGQATARVTRLDVLEEDVPCRHVAVIRLTVDSGKTVALLAQTGASGNRVTVQGVLARNRSNPVRSRTRDGLTGSLEATLEFHRPEPLRDQPLSALLVQGERIQFAIREALVAHDVQGLPRRLPNEVHRSIHPVLHLSGGHVLPDPLREVVRAVVETLRQTRRLHHLTVRSLHRQVLGRGQHRQPSLLPDLVPSEPLLPSRSLLQLDEDPVLLETLPEELEHIRLQGPETPRRQGVLDQFVRVLVVLTLSRHVIPTFRKTHPATAAHSTPSASRYPSPSSEDHAATRDRTPTPSWCGACQACHRSARSPGPS